MDPINWALTFAFCLTIGQFFLGLEFIKIIIRRAPSDIFYAILLGILDFFLCVTYGASMTTFGIHFFVGANAFWFLLPMIIGLGLGLLIGFTHAKKSN